MYRVMHWSTNQSLEMLWGLEGLEPASSAAVTIERPTGFRVIEPSPRLEGGSWLWYLIVRGPIDSSRAARSLASRLGASRWGLLGLKDACALVWQYVAVKARSGPDVLGFPWGSAFLVGRGGAPRLGMHGYNIFSIDIKVLDGDPKTIAGILESYSVIPGFFGPQRFGVERPNTHYVGLLVSEGRLGELLAEYAYRYPGESRAEPGSYERRAIARSARESSIAGARAPRIAREALQAYIFNRALSSLWPEYRRYAEAGVDLVCAGRRIRAPAVRLPYEGMRASRSPWAGVVARVLREEGLGWDSLKGLRGALRPLAYPVCGLRARVKDDSIRVRFMLPRGAYATLLARSVALVDWVSYDRCGSLPSHGFGYRGGY